MQFFPQKKDCFSTHQSAIEKLQQFTGVPILMAADKPCPQLQPSLDENTISEFSLLSQVIGLVSDALAPLTAASSRHARPFLWKFDFDV